MTIREIIQASKKRIQSSDIATRMASGAFWSFTGTATAKAMVMVAGILCARILGKELYGQYGLVKNTINTFMVLGSIGLRTTATKYISEYRQNSKERISSIYYVTNGFSGVMAILMALLLFLFSDYLAINVLNTPSLSYTLRIASLALIIVVVNVAQEGVLIGFEDFKGKAISTFYGSIIQVITLLTFAYLWGLNGAVIGYSIGFCVIAVINKYIINRDFSRFQIERSVRSIKKEDLKLLYRFALPASLSSLLIGPTYFVLRLMIKRYSDFSSMADYDVGDQWRLLILFIPASICSIVLPILSSINKQEKQKFWKVLKLNLLINGSVATVLALLVTLFSGVIISFYGKEFNNPMPLIILSLSCIFSSMSAVFGSSIASLGRMWASCIINFVWALLLILLAYMFLERGFGSTGVAFAILVSYIVLLLIQYVYLRLVHPQSLE